jgi:hypothetical protein
VVDDDFISMLLPAWNMIGIPGSQGCSCDDMVVWYGESPCNWTEATSNANPSGSLLIDGNLFAWDRSAQAYDIHTSVLPGNAYWLYSYETCILKRGF